MLGPVARMRATGPGARVEHRSHNPYKHFASGLAVLVLALSVVTVLLSGLGVLVSAFVGG